MSETSTRTTYWLSRDDRIVHVGSTWDQFARDNGGHDAIGAVVLGRSLAEFISGTPTRMWIDTILSLARLRGEPIERPYRCDTPTLRRHMRMTVTAEEGGVLRLDHVVLATEPRPLPVEVVT
ncbi:hypothetical protein GF314_07410, partial [bacterium]|nr:hypothetical protein [bacterium]